MWDDPRFSWLTVLAYGSFGAIGGFLGYLMRTVDAREKINWFRAALEGIGAGFVGLLVMLACNAMNISAQWTGVIVGVCGWLGANVTIRILEKLVRKKLGVPSSNTAPAPLDEVKDVQRTE